MAGAFAVIARHSGLLCVLMHWYVVTPVNCESRTQSCYHSNCSSTIPLYIGGMLSMTVGWDGTGCLVAAELAMEQINNRSDILQGYELRMASKDTQCAAKLGPRVLFHHIYNEPQKYAIFGPPCSPSALIVASASTYWNLLTVIYAALSPLLSDRVKYPNVYRVNPIATALFNDVFIWMMQTYHWRRVGYVAFSVESILQVQNTFIEQAAAINATVVSEVVRDTAKNQVENLKRENVRIIMAYVFEGQARLIFCEAFKIGFYSPEILWVFPGWFKANWWLIEDAHVNCTAAEINEVVYTTNILGMDVPVISPLEKLTVAGITPTEFVREMERRLEWPRYDTFTFNNYVAYAYDAVWTIGLMLNRTVGMLEETNNIKRLEDFTYTDNGMYQLFFDGLAATDFFGATGHVKFLEGERLGGTDISQVQAECDLGWILHNRNCFLTSNNETADWSQAVTSCEMAGANLADLSQENELSFLLENSMSSESSSKWHVGCRSNTVVEDNFGIQNNLTSLWNRTEGNILHCFYVDFDDNGLVKPGNCLQERPFICKKSAALNSVPIATYTSDAIIWKNDLKWAGGRVPMDRPAFVSVTTDWIEILIPSNLHILVTSLTATGILVSLVVILLMFMFSIRQTFSPRTTIRGSDYIILISSVLMYLSVICTKSHLLPSLSDQHHLIMCQVHDIIASLSFIMGVSTLVARMWVVYKSAAYSSAKHMVHKTWMLNTIILVFTSVDVICLLLKHILHSAYIETVALHNEVDEANPNHVTEYYFKRCSSGDAVTPLLLAFGDKTILLLIGSFLSYEIGQANLSSAGESKQVAICIYNIILFGVCGLILTSLLKNTPTESYIFTSSMIICCTTFTIIVLYLPKVIHIIKDPTENETEQDQSQRPSSVSNVSMLPAHVPKELWEENLRLRKEYQRLQQLVLERTGRRPPDFPATKKT